MYQVVICHAEVECKHCSGISIQLLHFFAFLKLFWSECYKYFCKAFKFLFLVCSNLAFRPLNYSVCVVTVKQQAWQRYQVFFSNAWISSNLDNRHLCFMLGGRYFCGFWFSLKDIGCMPTRKGLHHNYLKVVVFLAFGS